MIMRILSGSMSPFLIEYEKGRLMIRSEGPQPHTIDLRFPKRSFVSVCLPYFLPILPMDEADE
jgi:hypothetical protein